jgi:hypothetical protein
MNSSVIGDVDIISDEEVECESPDLPLHKKAESLIPPGTEIMKTLRILMNCNQFIKNIKARCKWS